MRTIIVSKMVFNPGEAMTKWWCKLSGVLLWFDIVAFFLVDLSDYSLLIKMAKGTAASSAACIGIGYYVCMAIYNSHHSPNLCKALYEVQDLENIMEYRTYVKLDIFIHILCTSFICALWFEHITLETTILAFIFHRSWSFVNSGGKTVYLPGDSVYQMTPLPWWGWPVIYTGESTVLVLTYIFSRITL